MLKKIIKYAVITVVLFFVFDKKYFKGYEDGYEDGYRHGIDKVGYK